MGNDRAALLSVCRNIDCHGRREVKAVGTRFHEITVQDNGVAIRRYKVKFRYDHPGYLRREDAALLRQTDTHRDY